MIATANLEKYRNGDFIQFVNNVLQLLPENVATNLQVATQRAELQNLALQFQDAFKPVSGNELTPEIEALDKQRDEALTGIRYLLDAYNHHYNDALRNSAFILLDVYKSYGDNIQRLRYQLETATVDALLNNWADSHQAHIDALQLNDWVAQLQTYNQQFNEKYISRTQQLAGVENGVMVSLREQATKAYRTLKAHIEAHALINPTATYTETMAHISALADQYNTAVTKYTSAEETGNPDPQVGN